MDNEAWISPRRCLVCLSKRKTIYLWCQKWGKTAENQQQFKLDCRECGYHEMTTWKGIE